MKWPFFRERLKNVNCVKMLSLLHSYYYTPMVVLRVWSSTVENVVQFLCSPGFGYYSSGVAGYMVIIAMPIAMHDIRYSSCTVHVKWTMTAIALES